MVIGQASKDACLLLLITIIFLSPILFLSFSESRGL